MATCEDKTLGRLIEIKRIINAERQPLDELRKFMFELRLHAHDRPDLADTVARAAAFVMTAICNAIDEPDLGMNYFAASEAYLYPHLED